jgi:hypothetical protein
LAVPEFVFEMRRRGHGDGLVRRIVRDNPLAFFSQCARFDFASQEPMATTHAV